MTASSAPAHGAADISANVPAPGSTSTAAPAAAVPPERALPAPAAPGGPWLMAALILAGAAQLIIISALVSADPVAATWASLLLAIAPAPLVAVAAYAPAPIRLPAAVAAAGVLVAGIVGEIAHIGLWFLPALVLLVVGAVLLWRERS